ncbi:MAG TPA: hypothetical protein PKM43_21300 [Verrucomicrobiota bacterium]|nr:hypothetical protein [Verrucomicrobiota bacterium]
MKRHIVKEPQGDPAAGVAVTASVRPLEPEFIRLNTLQAMFGIGRSLAYVLAERGEIQMVHLRPPGTKKGTCIVALQSVRDFIARRCGQKEAA